MRLHALFLLCALWVTTRPAAAGQNEPVDHRWVVCPTDAAPTVDGTLAPGEWDTTTAFLASDAYRLKQVLAPPEQRAAFHLTYDATHLYLAMQAPLLPQRYPRARVGWNDFREIYQEDRLEWQILTHAPEAARRAGKGFYKLVVNAHGALLDEWHWGPPHERGIAWDSEARCASRVAGGAWTLEVALPLAALGVTSLEGKSWRMQAIRADSTGHCFTGWGSGNWLAWNRAPVLSFGAEQPAVQLLGLGDISAGRLDLRLRLGNRAETPRAVEATVRLTHPVDGRHFYADTKACSVPPDGTQTFRFAAADLSLPPEGAELHYTVRQGTAVLLTNTLRVRPLTEADRNQHLEPWRRGQAEALPAVEMELPLEPTTLLDRLAALRHRAGPLMGPLQQAFVRQDLQAAEKLAHKLIDKVPFFYAGHIHLARVHVLQGHPKQAMAALQAAAALGGVERPALLEDKILASLSSHPDFAALLKRLETAPPLLPNRPATPATPAAGIAWVGPGNTDQTPDGKCLQTHFAFPTLPADKAIHRETDGVGAGLRAWWEAGTAAGNWTDLYDNRDSDHSNVKVALFPQLTRIEYRDEARAAGIHHGLPHNLLHRGGVVVGNASLAQTQGPHWRSLPRHAYVSQERVDFLWQQYTQNHLYVYPEHRDHDPGHNGKDGGYGDVYCANTPYLLISQGSSGSDRAFLRALYSTLAAFRPETKQALTERQLVAPTLQRILRACLKGVNDEEAYLSGRAHPAVFAGSDLRPEAMAEMAHAMPPAAIPPRVELTVETEDKPVAGRDFFSVHPDEVIFTTPGAVARVFRGVQRVRRMKIRARAVPDAEDRPLTFRWVVLRGNEDAITITPLDEDGAAAAELVIPWHARRPFVENGTMASNRIDIGVFAHNGHTWSAPAFITWYSLDHEERIYDKQGRIVAVTYRGADEAGNYVDPLVACAKSWRDEYHYDGQGTLTGWTRLRGDTRETFAPTGERLTTRDDGTKVREKVTYAAERHPRGPGHPPVLRQKPARQQSATP